MTTCDLPRGHCLRGRLDEISDPPEQLWLQGDPQALALPLIAVVGTRKPSLYGKRAAFQLSRSLSLLGFGIVSGLARGIDAVAHRAALAAGGRTIAVLGHGFGRIYPSEHRSLAEEITLKGGCLLTEYATGTAPLQHHFPERNRIIAGLTVGTVVVEAAEKSGSLITARCAVDEGREVFVIPGPFDDKGFSGGHRLIQKGAKLVTSLVDIVEELTFLLPSFSNAPAEQMKDYFGAGVSTLEDLVLSSGKTISAVMEMLEPFLHSGDVVELAPQHFAWVGCDVALESVEIKKEER
jgi:DNA processing protein